DDDFPLRESAHIVQANALTLDWNTVLPADQCSYVLGNPPFIGYSRLDESQKVDRLAIFGKVGGVLDYVACWYRKAADYMRGNREIQAAFVSTNSIVQGQQVAPLWRGLFDAGIVLNFAHRTFIWANEASDQAHVYCVIIGFSYTDRKTKYVWDYAVKTDEDTARDATPGRARRGGVGVRHEVNHLNGYLADAPDVFIDKRTKPLSAMPSMTYGFKPADGGFLLLSPEERDEFLASEPEAEKWIRPFVTAKEFISGKQRYCLWLPEITPDQLAALPKVRARVQACRQWRLEQVQTGDAYKLADRPHLLRPTSKFKEGIYIVIPRHSSERRKYVPLGFLDSQTIPGDSVSIVPNADIYLFGVLMSQTHNAWMRAVAGRLKSDYRYSSDIVYNNFVWPDAAPAQRERIEHTAQGILEARSLYPDASLATLYDPDLMPVELRAAHRENDRAVEAAYGLPAESDEAGIVSHLFALYATKTCSTPGKCG
ncbi:class I SAM-dependent DNA methyltransferase, partial [Mobiluncus curtisii]